MSDPNKPKILNAQMNADSRDRQDNLSFLFLFKK